MSDIEILPITFKLDDEAKVAYSDEFKRLAKLTKSKNLCKLFKDIAKTISYKHSQFTSKENKNG